MWDWLLFPPAAFCERRPAGIPDRATTGGPDAKKALQKKAAARVSSHRTRKFYLENTGRRNRVKSLDGRPGRCKQSDDPAIGASDSFRGEYFAYFTGKGFWRERFLQECQARLQNALVDDRVIGVTRDVKHLHCGARSHQASGQLRSADSRHDHIGHHQMNPARVPLGNLDGLRSARSQQDHVACFFQGSPRDLKQSCVVLDDQNRLASLSGGPGAQSPCQSAAPARPPRIGCRRQ